MMTNLSQLKSPYMDMPSLLDMSLTNTRTCTTAVFPKKPEQKIILCEQEKSLSVCQTNSAVAF